MQYGDSVSVRSFYKDSIFACKTISVWRTRATISIVAMESTDQVSTFVELKLLWNRHLGIKIVIMRYIGYDGDNWASEVSPTLGYSIEISRDICRYVCLSWSKKRRRKYGQMRACSKSVLGGKIRPVTPVLFISTIRYSSFSMDGRETFT